MSTRRRDATLQLNHKPNIYLQGRARVFLSCFTNTERRATPEELVREMVLHWLLIKQKFERSRIRVEGPVQFAIGQRGRADIVINDAQQKPVLVIECKRPGVTGLEAESQAMRYAGKLRAPHVWITDGVAHRALSKQRDGTWRQTDDLPFLPRLPTTTVRALPRLRCSATEAKRYVNLHLSRPVTDPGSIQFALAVHRIIFARARFATPLPYSLSGLHILEDRGQSDLAINTPGGPWRGSYRIFRAGTKGRIETAGIGVNAWGDGSLRLFVAFFDPFHHALQLDVAKYCDWNADGSFEIYHDGRFGGRSLKRAFILETLREAGCDDLLTGDSARPIYLGHLPPPHSITWRGTRNLLSNLLHYGLVRHSIRTAHPYRSSDD
jgi:hypothetical protein